MKLLAAVVLSGLSVAACGGGPTAPTAGRRRCSATDRVRSTDSCPGAQSRAGSDARTCASADTRAPACQSCARTWRRHVARLRHDAGRTLAYVARAGVWIVPNQVGSTDRDLWCSHGNRRCVGADEQLTGDLRETERPQPANRVRHDDGGGIVDPCGRARPGVRDVGRRALSARPTRAGSSDPVLTEPWNHSGYQFFNRMFRVPQSSSARRRVPACRWRRRWAGSADHRPPRSSSGDR